MKVKNIMFSGFAAAIFAGVCGAADAATLNLASKQYVDDALGAKASVSALADVQTQVTANTSDIAGLKTDKADASVIGTLGESATVTEYVNSAVQGAISDAVAGEGAVKEAIDAAVADKQNKLENADVLESITADDIAAIEANTTNITNLTETVQNLDTTVAGKANSADVTAALALKADKTAIADMATQTAVAADIATALQAAKDYADANDADTVYVDTEIRGLISDNAAEIAKKANAADVYTKTEVDDKVASVVAGDLEEALTSYAKTEDVVATYATKQSVTDLTTTVGTKADTSVVKGIDTRLTTAESDIEALQTATDDLGALAYKDTVSSTEIDNAAVTTDKIAGATAADGEMMMMSTGPDGVVTWTSVKVY